MTCFSACLRDLESMGVSARGSGAADRDAGEAKALLLVITI